MRPKTKHVPMLTQSGPDLLKTAGLLQGPIMHTQSPALMLEWPALIWPLGSLKIQGSSTGASCTVVLVVEDGFWSIKASVTFGDMALQELREYVCLELTDSIQTRPSHCVSYRCHFLDQGTIRGTTGATRLQEIFTILFVSGGIYHIDLFSTRTQDDAIAFVKSFVGDYVKK